MPILTTLGAACAKAWGFTSGLVKDQYFNLVSLLLPGNGTNGAQNNTFLDSSTNNFTITRNGNTTQGTFSPFSQTGWGNYFDGSGDYLTTPNNAALTLGSGDFTIEMWIFCPNTANGNIQILYDQRSASGQTVPTIYLDTNGYLQYFVAGANKITYSTAVTSNAWNHIAISRSGSNTIMFLNGAQVGSTYTTLDTLAGNAVGIGAYLGTPSLYYTGYMSNVRVVKGTAVYTSNFTPSTAPLTAITNTQLLTCQSNRFIDNSSNAFAITVNGNTSVVAFSPFAPTAAYTTAAVGGSGYFDGTGDYLEISNNAAFQFGSGDFTLESWVYLTSYNASTASIIIQKYTGAFPNCEFLFQIGTNGSIGLAVDSTSAETFIGTTSNAVPVAAWTHCVATKSGSALRIFVNGKLVKYGTTALTIATTTTPVQIGNNMFGYSGGTRVFKGSIPTDYQTSNTTEGTQIFTPPTAPLTTTSQGGSSPSLLLNFTNAGITDATAKNDLETVGNAQISTTQSKWGGSSISFDGSGDYLMMPSSSFWGFGTGDFTIEFWWYPNTLATYQQIIMNANDIGPTGAGEYVITYNTTLGLRFFIDSGTTVIQQGSTSGWSTGQWYYVAAVRSGNTLTLYRNGSSIGSGSVTGVTIGSSSVPFYLGGEPYTPTSINGYVQDLRVTKGYARTITASPTAPFPRQ